ncbi:MAG: hypothetical protein RLZZ336_910 [Cyanobacteriota bacterium]|jgi:hypothetical protein
MMRGISWDTPVNTFNLHKDSYCDQYQIWGPDYGVSPLGGLTRLHNVMDAI